MKNKLDKSYQDLLSDIMGNGIKKADRTGTGTKSVFGRQIRHDMSTGFPLLTTKKMAWKAMVTELLWFLKGDTNIKYLVDNGCNIWNGDAYKNYEKYAMANSYDIDILSMSGFINEIKTNDEFAQKWGELGPIYGRQWREWGAKYETNHILQETKRVKPGIDQLNNLIEEIKSNPDSRRLMLSGWNVEAIDSMVLPPCHYGFQIYTQEMDIFERRERWSLSEGHNKYYAVNLEHEDLDSRGFPRRRISLAWNQRSVDTFLGLPFNIASYGLLLMIIAEMVGMLPDQLIGNLGDTHLYLDHLKQARVQVERNSKELPTVNVTIPTGTKLEDLTHENITLVNYESHEQIKAPLSN